MSKELIGWVSSAVLVVTLVTQVSEQYNSKAGGLRDGAEAQRRTSDFVGAA